jgi:hypothetical protein
VSGCLCFLELVLRFVCDGRQNRGTYLYQALNAARNFVAETFQMLLQALGEYSLSRTAVFECHSRSKAGRVSVEDESSGRTNNSATTEIVETFRKVIHEHRRRTIHELAETVKISYLKTPWPESASELYRPNYLQFARLS